MICSERTFLTTADNEHPLLSASYDSPLRYFTGHPTQAFSEGETFRLKTVHNAIYHFSVTENTIYSADQFTEKNRLHILCKKRKGQSDFEAMAVCSTEDFEVFRRFRDLNVKLKATRPLPKVFRNPSA